MQICVTTYGVQWDIRFNAAKSFDLAKSQIASFGGKSPDHDLVHIGSKAVKWSEHVKYIGCYFRCSKGEVDPSCFVGKFYGTFNNILNFLGSKRD